MDLGQWQPFCERPTGLVAPVRIDPCGRNGPTRGQAQGPFFRRTSPGRFVPTEVDGSIPEQRILEQSGRLRSYGAITGWASLRWRGAPYFTGLDIDGTALPVPLVLGPAHLRGDDQVHLSQEQLALGELEVVAGVPCTVVVRALFDEVRRVARFSLREAVVAIDMASAAGLVSVDDFRAYVEARWSWTGVPVARKVAALASDGSLSPQEVRMRLVWVVDAGLPAPLVNCPVYDLNGRLLGIPDLLDPVAGVAGEYQGADHRRPERHRRDVTRMELLREHGLEYFEVVGGDLLDRARVVARMQAARRRARFASLSSRAWTLTPPNAAHVG